jgi:predicted SnoaL-like aldol condensation-catalyzing enzyme
MQSGSKLMQVIHITPFFQAKKYIKLKGARIIQHGETKISFTNLRKKKQKKSSVFVKAMKDGHLISPKTTTKIAEPGHL